MDDAMRRLFPLSWWKAGGSCRIHEACVVGIDTLLLRIVLVGVKIETLKTLPSKYC